jgi:hypothetical protein
MIIFLRGFNSFVFVTEMLYVFCEAETEYEKKNHLYKNGSNYSSRLNSQLFHVAFSTFWTEFVHVRAAGEILIYETN